MTAYANTAITFGSLKSGRGYFDHVVPVTLGRELIKKLQPGELGSLRENLNQILPPALRENTIFTDQLVSLNLATANLTLKIATNKLGLPLRPEEFSDTEYALLETAATAFYRFIDEFSLRTLPLDCGRGVPSDESEPGSETVLSLVSLNLIDADRSTW